MFFFFMLILCIFARSIFGEKIDEIRIDHNVLYLRNVLRPSGVLKFSLVGLKDTKAEFKENPIVFIHDGSQLIKFHKTRNRFNHTVEYDFVWFNVKDSYQICLHYAYNNASWYSTYDEFDNRWPITKEKVNPKDNKIPIDPKHPNKKSFTTGGSLGSVIEYLFVNTDGFVLMLDHLHPWFIERKPIDSTNREPLLCLSLSRTLDPYNKKGTDVEHSEKYYSFRFKILTGTNIRAVHQAAIRDHRYIDTPNQLPDLSVMKAPSWDTLTLENGRNKRDLDFDAVVQFAQKIFDGNYPHFLFVIDGDNWQKGDKTLTFRPNFFNGQTNATFMVEKLRKLGFQLSLYIPVYVDEHSSIMKQREDYLLIKTKSAKCHTIDFTNPQAIESFVSRLNLLRTKGIYTFKFVQGHVESYSDAFNGKCSFKNGEIVGKYPNFVSIINGLTNARLGNSVEIQAAFRVQRLPLFVRGLSKEPNWELEKGLKSELINILTLSIGGYSFYKSDFICAFDYCSDELFIRWMQAVIFFPGIQFSIPPWTRQNKTKVTNITKDLMQLRAQFMPKMIDLAKRVVHFGEPMIRPMWYEAPDDPRSYAIWDQYMLGSDLLVAPVVYNATIKRDVYFPSGTWRDQHNKDHVGSKIETISAPLYELPYFVRV